MKVLFLTSCLDCWHKDDQGNRVPHNFGNENQILENLKKYLTSYKNMLYVHYTENEFEINDYTYNNIKKSFELTLPFENYNLLDGRTKKETKSLIMNADLIYLGGGHLPTQNKFFKKFKLVKLLKKTNAVIVAGSAGSMNCADIVYSSPEMEGEAIDKKFKRYIKGLGLTKISIYPHWNTEIMKSHTLDGLNLYNEILFLDSYVKPFICLPDGSYILQTNEETKVFGEAYYFSNGEFEKICNENEIKNL